MILFPINVSFEIPIFDAIGNVLTAIGLWVAYYQFTKQNQENRRLQKEQNEKNWYISVIVIPQLSSINSMFESLIENVDQSYKQLKFKPDLIDQAARQSESKEIISSSLSHVQQMVSSYDREGGLKISEIIDEIQDCVTKIIGSAHGISKNEIREQLLNYNGKLISALFECSKK